MCTQGSSTLYKNIIIPSGEHNVFLIFNDDSITLDCNLNQYGFSRNIIQKSKTIWGSCTSKCLRCNGNCIQCLDGFELTSSSEYNLIKDKINYIKFHNLKNFSPFRNTCISKYQNFRQLFIFQFS